MKFRFTLLLVLIALFVQIPNSFGQSLFKRYINSILMDTSDITRPQFLVYPTLAYAPETSWEIGLSSLYVYYANRDTTNRLSEVNGFTFVTLENQYGLWFDHALYTDENKWLFLGRIRVQSFPLFYHGIGMDTPEDYTARVDANQIIIKERALRKVGKNFFVGPELDFQRTSSVNFVPRSEDTVAELPLGYEGSNNLGLGLGLVYDSRHNVLNVRDAFFSELALLKFDGAWGSTFDFTSVISDTRIYRPMGKNNVLAAQLLGQFNFGQVPFNQLALLGGESIMRGYYYGRFRDNHQLASQVEYRFLPLPLGFTDRIGAAVFAGAGTVFPEFDASAFKKVVFSAGGGLRFLLFPKKDIYTRLDVAFTQEGTGFYIFIGEAF
ncbi:BamA/TamA family outer membrane protein [Litoribacter ruber]|uniref:BamA/TamA family outer membrane protein n=1 Tax=Litoribacter ruber TaxID=702568 RepID=A0AAP2CH17_9BACT|nr:MULTISPECIES: BamA/TamA family outer membrane protein [Litoribacter]MBS9523554.1 BamA/TamA family outer membrane protein [Litoribacter alkaliphilus]MBT0812029.1 BamA/TamA family outer membrane protein [Litoribacter ruber]